MKYSPIFIFLSFIVFLIIIYITCFIRIDFKKYFEYLKTINSELINHNIAKLLNADTLNNLPYINIITNNDELNQFRQCNINPIKLAELDNTENIDETKFLTPCYNHCGNSASVVIVKDGDEIYADKTLLTPGIWCMNELPKCNTKFSSFYATATGVTCRSKFPNIFDNSGYNIIACNDNIYNKDNILWDYKNNRAVDDDTNITDENELLDSGLFRFRCKFGFDDRENQIIEHPLNRFMPLSDPCIYNVYAASTDAHTNYKVNDNKIIGYECDCGNFHDTRLKNKTTKFSTCTSCILDKNVNIKTYEDFSVYGVPHNCFTMNSFVNYSIKNSPCPPTQFISSKNNCTLINIDVNTKNKSPEEISTKLLPISKLYHDNYDPDIIKTKTEFIV